MPKKTHESDKVDKLNLYKRSSLRESANEYVRDGFWKVQNYSLISEVLCRFEGAEINLLDVVGGTCLILARHQTGTKLQHKNKFELDMSPANLKIQLTRT
jgi:hypothetical protein